MLFEVEFTVAAGLTVIVNVFPAILAQPFPLLTVMVPVYVPTGVFAGTAIVTGLEGNAAFVTGTKLLAGDTFQVIL